jgi:cytochrome P450
VRLHLVRPTLLIHDPRDIQHVLVDREDHYRKSDRVVGRAGQQMFARGLLTREWAAQRLRRRLVQPHFHRRVIASFVDVMDEEVRHLLDSWNAGFVDLTAEMDRFSERLLIRTLIGEVDEDTRRRISWTNRARRRLIGDAFGRRFPFPHLLPTRTNWRYRRASRVQRATLRSLVRKARDNRLDPRSLLALMAGYETGEGSRLDDDALVEEMVELLTAGIETTRETLTWAVFAMAAQPRHAAGLASEAARVLEDRRVRPDDLPKLEHAEMFLSEVMRLYPAAWMFVRLAAGDDELPTGARVGRGWKICLCPYTSHRNPAYFPDPERFDPSRFSREAREARPRFAYFPFGGGPRVCVAEPLIRVEGVVLLAALARRYSLALVDERPIEPVGAITLRPKGSIRISARPI